ncbi:MAG: hypothetical protein HOM11_06515 [Methylococcales bacterium]|nr:hypothetical protein [Methylococcales bacterium]MBT7445291.1 hypothetical protein [Methylococcales bacterium]
MTTSNSLGLLIPNLTLPTKQSFNTAPRKVSAWIQSLPVTNIGNTARDVFSAVTEMNQLDIPPINRVKAIELFRPTINYIIDNLEKHYLNVPFPLSVKARKVAHLCQKLNAEMSVSYKIVIEQLLQEKGDKFDKKMMAICLHRCTHYLGRVVYQGALVYEPTPDNTWKELHRIYLFAEQYRLHALPVKDPEDKSKAPSSLEEIYKRLLMLSLIDPHHLRQRETQEACQLFEQWSSKAHLVPITEQNKTHEKYFINLWSDQPPSQTLMEGNLQLVRGIDISSVIQHLQAHLNDSHDNSGLSSAKVAINQLTQRSLFQSLINALTSSKNRAFPRKEGAGLFNLTLNIQHAHDYLASKEDNPINSNGEPLEFDNPFGNELADDEDWFDKKFQKKVEVEEHSRLDDITLSGLSMMPKDDLLGVGTGINATDNPFLNPDATSAIKKVEKKVEDKPLYQCTTINESAGGYCFTWSSNSPSTQIGELVGIVTENDQKVLRIGIVRWIKHPIGQELQFGVEMIAPSAIKAVTNKQNQTQNDKSLLLPEIKVINQEATLLTQAMQYKPGTVLTINTETSNMKVKIKAETESTSAFTRYRFDVLESDTATNNINSADDKDEDLDSLWSML